ncbi:FAD-binding oxidoreductase [Candidatus Pelagibacter bacterium]|nr:FAD-binding oxidoreductase [Candidatus Pelagibacter bacterium]
MQIINDSYCSWINNLDKRTNIQVLLKDHECEWLIIGAGFTGLSAARKLAEIYPNKTITLIDAQLAGEGASSRNSGYLVDTTLNDGFTSDTDLENYKKKTDIYKLGIEAVKKFIQEYQVDCDFNECGKYYASSKIDDQKTLENFSKILSKLNYENHLLFKDDLKKQLGTNFYNVGLYTKGGILLNPGKLVRAMINALPNNVNLLENSFLINWKINNGKIICEFEKGTIKTKKIIFATNGFLKSLGIKKNYNFPLTLTASMTRPLNSKEYSDIGSPKEWGVLSVRPMGATVRMTKDKRIMIRNTAEVSNPFKMSKMELDKRAAIQKIGIKKRFPQLPSDIIESTWSGVVSRSRNSSQIFEKLEDNVFVAGCYNGSGIGVGTLFGEQIAIKAANETSEEIKIIEKKKKPKWLPPTFFLDIGVKTRLMYERLRSRSDI